MIVLAMGKVQVVLVCLTMEMVIHIYVAANMQSQLMYTLAS